VSFSCAVSSRVLLCLQNSDLLSKFDSYCVLIWHTAIVINAALIQLGRRVGDATHTSDLPPNGRWFGAVGEWLRNDFGQVIHASIMCLSPSSIIWYCNSVDMPTYIFI